MAGSLRAALGAALLSGLAWGALDGLIAQPTRLWSGLGERLGCLAGAVLVYTLVQALVLGAAALALHAWLARRDATARLRALLSLGLSLAAAAEAYWWSRPWLYPGYSSVSPQRLLVAAGCALAGAALGAGLAALFARAPRRAHTAAFALAGAIGAAGALYVALDTLALHRYRRGELNERNAQQPNVLLIVVDALRADVLACYGHPRVRTPNIDALAARGVLFERAYAQAPFTGASFGSILSGKYPRRHGFVRMDPSVRMRPNANLPWHLKSAPRVDGGRMQDGDFATATFMTGALRVESGLMRGFDTYFEAMEGHERVELDSAWSQFRSELLLSLFKNKLTQRFDSGLVASAAADWLREQRERRFCAMVHLYSTHTPYDPPAALRADYCDPAYQGPISAFYAKHREAIEAGQYTPTPADVAQIQNLYFAGVAQADQMVGQLMDALEASGALAHTLVILTSDHGENLGEPDPLTGTPQWEHNHVNELNLRVPLILALPGKLPAGARVSALVESVDLLPTVNELAGLLPPDETLLDPPYRQLDGHSLVGLATGARASVRSTSFSENALESSACDERWRLVVARAALTEGNHDGLASVAGRGPWLYAIDAPAAELRDVAAEQPEVVARLWKELQAWNASLPIPLSDIVLSPRDYDQTKLLDDLGYSEQVRQERDAAAPPRAHTQ